MSKFCYISFRGYDDTENVTFLHEDEHGNDVWKRFWPQKEKRQIRDYLKKDLQFVVTQYVIDRLSALGYHFNEFNVVNIRSMFLDLINWREPEDPKRSDMCISLNIEIKETEPEFPSGKGYQICQTYKKIHLALLAVKEELEAESSSDSDQNEDEE